MHFLTWPDDVLFVALLKKARRLFYGSRRGWYIATDTDDGGPDRRVDLWIFVVCILCSTLGLQPNRLSV
jgi:hypothetical protein